jgi:hypothetical protein
MGVAWPGEARRGGVRRGVAGTLKQHLARQGRTRPGRARLGKAGILKQHNNHRSTATGPLAADPRGE